MIQSIIYKDEINSFPHIKEKVNERLVKIINHEIGHTLNLLNCPVKDCLMEDGGGTIKTVDSENGKLCASSTKKVLKYLVKP